MILLLWDSVIYYVFLNGKLDSLHHKQINVIWVANTLQYRAWVLAKHKFERAFLLLNAWKKKRIFWVVYLVWARHSYETNQWISFWKWTIIYLKPVCFLHVNMQSKYKFSFIGFLRVFFWSAFNTSVNNTVTVYPLFPTSLEPMEQKIKTLIYFN